MWLVPAPFVGKRAAARYFSPHVEVGRFLGPFVLRRRRPFMARRPTCPLKFRRKISRFATTKRRLVAYKGFALVAFLAAAGLPAGAQISAPTAQAVLTALHWRNVGPGIGGRSVAVDAVPGTPYSFYFGAVDGGV